MTGVEALFLWIAGNFTPESYLLHSKVQGLLWSAADITLVWAFLRIADLGRRSEGKKPARIRYALLVLSAVATPLLLLSRSPREFFLLECVLCGVHFLILVYTVIMERETLMGYLVRVAPPREKRRGIL